MGAILIKSDNQEDKLKLIKALAQQLGIEFSVVSDEQYEEFVLGIQMEKQKTGELVSRESIFEMLKK